MTVLRFPRPPAVPRDEPQDRLVAWLTAHGVPTAWAYVDQDTDEILFDGYGDPTAALASYVSQPTKEELAWTVLRDVCRAMRTKPDPRTAGERLTDAERAILSLAVLARLDQD